MRDREEKVFQIKEENLMSKKKVRNAKKTKETTKIRITTNGNGGGRGF